MKKGEYKMKKYVLLAVIFHSFLFLKLNNYMTLGDRIDSKESIPISFNVKDLPPRVDGMMGNNQIEEEEEKIEDENNKEEKIEKEEEKKVEKDEDGVKKVEKKIEKKEKRKKNQKKSNSQKKSEKKKENSSSKNNGLIENSDGTYTAVSSKGIDFKILNSVEPNYPRQAQMLGYRKDVIIEVKFLVGLDGRVSDIKIIKSHKKFGFDNEVITALKKWRFEPIVYNGRKIKVYFVKEFIFKKK